MAPFPDEVDVFTGPHWRMKQLVGLYCDKLSKTNFSNNQDFRSFLRSLCDTFNEFKMHEQIENECIIGLLQQRSCTVYDVHSDNKLSEMLSLFEKGLCSVKSEHEQLNYARQLKERLEAFTQDFLPHMKEEEEVFQPMLMQYFSYEELKGIKKQVMAEHRRQQQRECAAEVLKGRTLWSQAEELQGRSLWSQAEELHKAFKYADHEKTHGEVDQSDLDPDQKEPDPDQKEPDPDQKDPDPREPDPRGPDHVSQLPPETLLRLLGYLGPADLCRCSQVCRRWAALTRTGSLWRHLYPVRWATGDSYQGPPGEVDQEPNEEWVRSRQHEGRAYQHWDEDADIDESEGSPWALAAVRREKALLKGLGYHLLPAVGVSVRSLVLAYSSTVSSKMVRQMLSLCPGLSHLDLTQTDISDSAFDCWSLGASPRLQHLDLSGCGKISDQTLRKLSVALGNLPAPQVPGRGGRLLRSAPLPVAALLDGRVPDAAGRKRQAIVFRAPAPGGPAPGPPRVWLLDPLELADIEDAAEWGRRQAGGDTRGLTGASLEGGSSSTSSSTSCCCRRSRRRAHRTALSASFLQHRLSVAAAAGGGDGPGGRDSSCCSGPAAPRTKNGGPCPPGGPPSQGPGGACTRPLRFLSLSGCHQVTDAGLRALSQRGGLPSLEHLNLSGCLLVTEVGLQELVSACPALNDEHFYYCDNIDGPHADTASGCQNLQCGFRACCRSGE
ncbi:F-box/LRR-repeat protein 5 isoform X1 [Gadus chalcogrammus]|uniref:F-box/LRR-repeat protein 5 isoform X1 n=1 Tax=Gadus chalcogrammus TaxID=1042646 RepID=UPI0024C4A43B|nr:F-box/LRR-repeat protein 5 isoform X1 [Gadus chalcogrammus]